MNRRNNKIVYNGYLINENESNDEIIEKMG